jgi:DeoR family transcriptional regulator, fructose operon transcriptional repressor
MLIPERQSRLKELLAQRGMANLDSLAAELAVSSSTVRRDVETLEQAGLVQRTHGGVVWVGEKQPDTRPYAFTQRMGFQINTKRRIARAAAQLVQPGETILIDGGTTTYYLAQELIGRSLQLVTNSLPIAELFLNDDNVELVLTGGLMYPRYGVLLGPMAEASIGNIHTKTLFMSVAGVHQGAMYNQNVLLVQAEQKMMAQAQQTVLLIDSSKFGQQALTKLGDICEVDIVVTDAIADEDRQTLEKAGCRVIVAA